MSEDLRSRHFVPLLSLALSLPLLVGCQPPEGGETAGAAVDTAAVMQALSEVRDAYEAAYNGGDAAGVAALYSANAVFSPPNGPAVTGREAIRAHFEEELAAEPTLRIEPRETTLAGSDWVVEYGTAEVSVAPEEGAEPRTLTGDYLVVLERTAEGWKLFRAFNSPHGEGGTG